ncbi:MAG: glycosyl hydrolase [Verrucomicrobiota bacterium]
MAISLSTAPASAQPKEGQVSPWGISSSAEWANEYPKFNPLLEQVGVQWIRYFPSWTSIQREGPNAFDWENADARMASAAQHGIQPQGMLVFFPRWASADGKNPRANPVKDIKYWNRYVTAAAKRYLGKIEYWECWNEFNGSFSVSKNKPKDYAGLVKGAYKSLKAVDPNLKLGISCANFDLSFFRKVIEEGAGGHFDFVCIHPYENLGQVMKGGGEPGFLSLAASTRRMLKDNGQDPNMPIWITEIGYKTLNVPNAERDRLQADAMVKCFTLSIASGIAVVEWFEARGPKYGKKKNEDYGLIRHDWTLRPAWNAFKQMTSTLGEFPEFTGWLNLGEEGGGYGFVFDNGQGENVLVAWAPTRDGLPVTFPGKVTVTAINGQGQALAAGEEYRLPWSPVYVTGLPSETLKQAKANRAKNFPWGGDFTEMTTVSHLLGSSLEQGLILNTADRVTIINDLTETYADTVNEKGQVPPQLNFRAHPSFLNASNTDKYEITVLAKRKPGTKKAPKLRILFYESKDGYKRTGKPWEVPAGDQWHEHSWMVDNANFVGQWGYNFCFAFPGKQPLLLKEVRLRKLN